MLGQRRGGERLGAVGQVEDVAVPVQDLGAGSEAAEHRVLGVADLDRGEADLRPLPRPHLGPERPRQQLRAEADAEHRQLPPHRLGQPLALGRQRREALDLVDVHRPAHDDRAGDLLVRRQRLAGERLHGVHVEGAAGVEDPVRPLPGHVLDRQQGGTLVHAHRRQASLGPELEPVPPSRALAPYEPQAPPRTRRPLQARGPAGDDAPAPRRSGPRCARRSRSRALAVGATAIGAFAIGRLSVGRLSVGRAKFGKVEIEELEVGRLTVREGCRSQTAVRVPSLTRSDLSPPERVRLGTARSAARDRGAR